MTTPTFTPLELDIATEIINIGLAKAADSLSFFTKERVLIRGVDITLAPACSGELLEKEGDHLTMLTTQLRGELAGYCYLIFDDEEVTQLAGISLPSSISTGTTQHAEMSKAILLEADNIITAAVVTQFSNLLQRDMHGYVPLHHEGDPKELTNVMRQNVRDGDMVLHFKALLVSSGNNIVPEFIWCMNSEFANAIKAFAESEENRQKLQSL